ncbi:hypothetical protein COBT_001721 [Conglomerata obtusa]
MQNPVVNPFVFQSNEFIMLIRGETSIDRPVFRKYFPVVITNAEIENTEECINDLGASPSESICIEELSNDGNRSSVCNIDFLSELSIEPRCEQGFQTDLNINISQIDIIGEKNINETTGIEKFRRIKTKLLTKLVMVASLDARVKIVDKTKAKSRIQRKIKKIFDHSCNRHDYGYI